MRPDRNAHARTRSDEAVRRLREESAQRVARERRWRGFTSWCALASLVGGVSLAALDVYDGHLQSRRAEEAAAADEATVRQRSRAEAVAADEDARRGRTAVACAKRDAALKAIDADAAQARRHAGTREESVNITGDVLTSKLAVLESAANAGCTEPVSLHDDL